MTRAEFAAQVKAKHPAYAGMEDGALVDAVLAKHPQYGAQITDQPTAAEEPSLVSKVLQGAQMLNPKRAASELYFNPKAREAVVEGLRGKDTQGTPEENALNMAGRYGPQTAAMLAVPAAGVESAVAARLGGGAMAGLGGLAARMGTAGAAGGLASLAGSAATGAPDPGYAAQTAKESAMGEGFGKTLEAGVPAAWRGAKAVGQGVLERATGLFSKTPAAAWETFKEAPEQVAEYARQGMTKIAETNRPIAKAMQLAQDLGRSAQNKVETISKGAGERFGQMMGYLKEDQTGVKFPVAARVYDKMEPFIDSQTAYRSAAQSATTEEHAKVFNHFYDRIRNTLQEGMAPGEVADLLQQMTLEQRTYKGTSLSAHLEKLKESVLDALPGEYRISHEPLQPEGWNIKDTRDEYRAAKQLQTDAAPYVRKEEPVSSFDRIMAAGGRTAQALKSVMQKSPGIAQDLTGMKTAKAGAEFAPWMTQLPQTGLAGGAMLALTKALSNPVAAAEVPVMALGMSPRLAMETSLLAGKGAKKVEDFVGAGAKALGDRALPAGLAALLKKNRDGGGLP